MKIRREKQKLQVANTLFLQWACAILYLIIMCKYTVTDFLYLCGKIAGKGGNYGAERYWGENTRRLQ